MQNDIACPFFLQQRTCPYPVLHKFTPPPPIMLILSFHLHLRLLSGFLTKTLCVVLASPVGATCPAPVVNVRFFTIHVMYTCSLIRRNPCTRWRWMVKFSPPAVLFPWQNPGTPWIGGWVSSVDGLDGFEEKISYPCRDSNPEFSILYLTGYTDYTILEREINFCSL